MYVYIPEEYFGINFLSINYVLLNLIHFIHRKLFYCIYYKSKKIEQREVTTDTFRASDCCTHTECV